MSDDVQVERVKQALDPVVRNSGESGVTTLDMARAAIAAMQDAPTLEEMLLGSLVSDGLPGEDIRLGYSDGDWHVSQETVGLEESWPTGVVGTGRTIRDAVRRAKEGS